MSKKVLIIGNSVKEYALAKQLSRENDVYVTPGSKTISEFATCLDIREDAISELLEYVMENEIDITIPISKKTLKTDIVEVFNKNNLQIFAPSKNAFEIISDKVSIKKTLYKLRIPTPKFGIFEKQNVALDYTKNLKAPFVAKTNEPSSAVILTAQKTAKNIIESMFAQKDQKVLIEDYIWGTPFTYYTITDGYKALPIGSSILYKHSLEGNGGQLTKGMGACIPNYKLSLDNEYFIMDNIVYPILEAIEMGGSPYLGILAVNAILTEDGNIQVLGFDTFLQDCDTSAILELLDTDMLNLIEACIIGSFSDEYDFIPQKELFATSLVLFSKNKDNNENSIKGLESLDDNTSLDFYPSVTKNKYLEYEAQTGAALVLTAFARTSTTATKKVYEEANIIDFKGITYRKDICKPIITSL